MKKLILFSIVVAVLFIGLNVKAEIKSIPSEEGEIKNLEIVSIESFPGEKRYVLKLKGEVANPVLHIEDYRLEKVITDTGEDLLFKKKRLVSYSDQGWSEYEVWFTVSFLYPTKDTKIINELSGILKYSSAHKTKNLNIRFADFVVGAKGDNLGATIIRVEEVGEVLDALLQSDMSVLTLKLDESEDLNYIQSVVVYDNNNERVDGYSCGYSNFYGIPKINYCYEGELPTSGKVVIEVLDDIKEYKVSFRISNFSLTDEPL